jgi:hypothetical protein
VPLSGPLAPLRSAPANVPGDLPPAPYHRRFRAAPRVPSLRKARGPRGGCPPPPTMDSLSASPRQGISPRAPRSFPLLLDVDDWIRERARFSVTAFVRFASLRSLIPPASPFTRRSVARTPRPILSWELCPSEAFSACALGPLTPKQVRDLLKLAAGRNALEDPEGSSPLLLPPPRDSRTARPPRQVSLAPRPKPRRRLVGSVRRSPLRDPKASRQLPTQGDKRRAGPPRGGHPCSLDLSLFYRAAPNPEGTGARRAAPLKETSVGR